MLYPELEGQDVPSKRKQINVRVDPETEQRIQRLLPIIKETTGLEITVSDLVRLGMIELERKHLGEGRPRKRKGTS
jgi:hypothetical protein